jgi:hypothetical protein
MMFRDEVERFMQDMREQRNQTTRPPMTKAAADAFFAELRQARELEAARAEYYSSHTSADPLWPGDF